MFIIYDLIFLVFMILYVPVYLFKKKIHSGFLMRLGIMPEVLDLNRPIWIHAVSVGEAMAIRALIEELRLTYPHKRLVISTVTSTGNKIAKSMAKKGDFISYLPLDLSFIVRAVLNRINPSIFIIVETEIWPNLISCLYRKNIPIIVVNARISDRSFRGYLSIKLLLKPILNKVKIFCVQTDRDAQRLMRLGVPESKILITGNMKFDTAVSKKDEADYRLKLGLDSREKLFVAASTHPGEEEIILTVFKNLSDEYPDLRLLIAPRHPERSPDIERLIKKFNFESVRISILEEQAGKRVNEEEVFILDAVGKLLSFYAVADIVFVGGSLVKVGGHNILEPASLGKPVLFGPYMHNFRDIADLFIRHKAAILVKNQAELRENIRYLLNNPTLIDNFKERSRKVILQNQGATEKNLEYISRLI